MPFNLMNASATF
jgi:hypothetical protein